MNRPLDIRDVENISLEATDDNSDMRQQLVPKFSCQYEAESECTSSDSYQNNLYIIIMLFSCLDDQCDTCCC